MNLIGRYEELKAAGLSEVEIAKSMGYKSTTELRAQKSVARQEARKELMGEAMRLRAAGKGPSEIGRRLGVNESTVRSLLNPVAAERTKKTDTISKALRDEFKTKKYIDIGEGTELRMGITQTALETAVRNLEESGEYERRVLKVEQMGNPGKFTWVKVLAPKGTPYKELYDNVDQIMPVGAYSENGGRSFLNLEPPVSIDPKRVQVRYAEDHGTDKDGVIELRRGVEDISLGNAHYAQVRIAVGGTHYLKGMAIYSDNLPDGVDILFNSNKHKGTPMMGDDSDNTVLKKMKDDKDNPFGASIRTEDQLKMVQRHYIGKDGKEHLSAINVVNEEGDWQTWSKTIASQVLSKQPVPLAKKQLELALAEKQDELAEINKVENPVVKNKLLMSFADDCEAAAVHLKAAALPRQQSHVILPVPSLKDNEVFAPNYHNGEEVVLIRYPHAGKFEIPRLKVNNKNAEALSIIGKNSRDAIGINPHVAQILSGADFDGDSVLVIPTKNQKIQTSSPLEGLKNFDPKEMYPKYPGMKVMDSTTKGKQMGVVTNLITDMTLKGADDSEIARAVRHSMVVIDAEKHELDWRRSERDNGIAELKRIYQNGGGASTLISKAKSTEYVNQRKEVYPPVDPETGKKRYKETGETYSYKDEKGRTITKPRMTKTTKMAEADDAFELSSGTKMETEYAKYANALKKMARESRLEAIHLDPIPYNKEAHKTYAAEVESLKGKLNIAIQNKPLERRAQMIAGKQFKVKLQANPEMDSDHKKKIRGQCLEAARYMTGAKKKQINISDSEWKAIQSGAISTRMLTQIIENSDQDRLKKLATPRANLQISDARIARIAAMANTGYTNREIADELGVSPSTVAKYLN
jgi:DNA-binding CsgD family transcriptional regulator